MIIYDSTNPYDIPTTAEAVAGYVDGIYAWDINGWARFPSQPKIGISVNPFNQIGDALDVETGDATPAQAPAWVKARLAQGAKQPWVYVNRGNQQATEDALWAAGIATSEVAMWVATLDGATSVPQYRYPIAAVQYANSTLAGGHYDLSVATAEAFGAATGTGEEVLDASDPIVIGLQNGIKSTYDELENVKGGVSSTYAAVVALKAELDALKAQVAALPAPSAAVTVPTQITLTGTLHS